MDDHPRAIRELNDRYCPYCRVHYASVRAEIAHRNVFCKHRHHCSRCDIVIHGPPENYVAHCGTREHMQPKRHLAPESAEARSARRAAPRIEPSIHSQVDTSDWGKRITIYVACRSPICSFRRIRARWRLRRGPRAAAGCCAATPASSPRRSGDDISAAPPADLGGLQSQLDDLRRQVALIRELQARIDDLEAAVKGLTKDEARSHRLAPYKVRNPRRRGCAL